jgi:hypothetical protein
LSKHDITRYKLAGRQETPSHFGSAYFIDLVNVRHYPVSYAVIYPISSAAVATDDLEVVFVIELGSSIWGQPISQKPSATGFAGILGKEISVKLAHSPYARDICPRPGSANEKYAVNRRRGEGKIEFLQRLDRMTELAKLRPKRCERQR